MNPRDASADAWREFFHQFPGLREIGIPGIFLGILLVIALVLYGRAENMRFRPDCDDTAYILFMEEQKTSGKESPIVKKPVRPLSPSLKEFFVYVIGMALVALIMHYL